jgi:2-polyprenyl-3-methyl-5-hydroxy-6-metoxy-1,4-benzoquinol methylase
MFDTQFLVDAVTAGKRVVEVPIPTRYTKESSSISISRSLKYVTGSVAYTLRRFLRRGRRGRRSPVTLGPARRGRKLGHGRTLERECVLCGGHDQMVVFPSNVAGEIPLNEFTCTTTALAQHDDILQCRRCGMVSAMPMIGGEEIVDGYRQVVDEAYLSEEGARRELFAWIADAMDGYVVPGKRLLEFGSSVGLFLSVAGDRGWDARGVEPSKWAVEQGRRLFGVALEQGSLEDFRAEPQSADVLVLLDVLEHVVDPLEALRSLRAALEPEGLLVLSTLNLAGVHARVRGDRWPWFIRSHLHYFTPETLSAMLAKAGYRMVGWESVPRSFHASYIASRLRESMGGLRDAAERITSVVDPEIPVGWLGDICLVTARPEPS